MFSLSLRSDVLISPSADQVPCKVPPSAFHEITAPLPSCINGFPSSVPSSVSVSLSPVPKA